MSNTIQDNQTGLTGARIIGSVQRSSFFSSLLNRVLLQCMVESYLMIGETSESEWNKYVEANWNQFFPYAGLTESIKGEVNDILHLDNKTQTCLRKANHVTRRYFRALGIVICEGSQNIQSRDLIKILSLVRLLANRLSLQENTDGSVPSFQGAIAMCAEFLSEKEISIHEEDITNAACFYYCEEKLSLSVIQILQKYAGNWSRPFQQYENRILRRNVSGNQKLSFLLRKINCVAFQCMAENYLMKCNSPCEKDWKEFMEENWSIYFPHDPLTDDIRHEINVAMFSNDKRWTKRNETAFECYCKSLGLAVTKGVTNIRSESLLRSLVLNRTAAMAVSLIDPARAEKKDVNSVVSDIFMYLSNVNYVETDDEESVITEIMENYLENGRFSRKSLEILQSSSDVLKNGFKNIKEFLNNRNKAISVLSDRLKHTEDSLVHAKFEALTDFINYIDRGGFGYQLGKLYRFASGLDTLSTGEAAYLLQCLFNQFGNMGISPIAAEWLDKPLNKNNEYYEGSVPEITGNDQEERILRFPGWSLNGITIVPPVYLTDDDKEENK